jgi:hypothetical protein
VIPHRERLLDEISEVFLNAKFHPAPEAPGTDLEIAEVCPGYLLVLDHDDTELNIRLADDWTCVRTYTEIILKPDAPDWDRFRRWLWDACYLEVRKVMLSICKTLGVSVAWPQIMEQDGRRYFKGRQPTEHVPDLFSRISIGAGSSHILTGAVGSGKTTMALRLAAEASKAGKTVVFVTTDASTATIASRLATEFGVDPNNPFVGLTIKSPQNNTVSGAFQTAEKVADADVRIIDSPYANPADQPKRLAMKTRSEVFVTVQSSRETVEDNLMDKLDRRCRDSVESVYWLQSPTTVSVVQHPQRGGVRYRIHKAAKPRLTSTVSVPMPSWVTPTSIIEVPVFAENDVWAECQKLILAGLTVLKIEGHSGSLRSIFNKSGWEPGQIVLLGGQPGQVSVEANDTVPYTNIRISYQ